jgi:hypothetical protein
MPGRARELQPLSPMAKFFTASLKELAARNPGIQVRFQPLGGQAFFAVVYRDGKTVAECSIRIGALAGARHHCPSRTAQTRGRQSK